MDPKINVILIGIDTLRADHLGCYGYGRPTSPNIDKLAKQSLLFKNCRSQAPHTAPSFMSIMTGRYPTYHGVTLNIPGASNIVGRAYGLDPDIPTLAKVLRDHGYRTGAFTDGGQMNPKLGFSNGFEYYSVNPKFGAERPIPQSEIFYWLKENSRNPFFLFFHTYAVHNPWMAPKEYQKRYNPGYSGQLENIPLQDGIKKNVYQHFIDYVTSGGPKELEQLQAMYDGAINYTDDFVGSLMNLLSEIRVSDKTMIIFTSDHGEEFLEHGRLSHEQLYREHLHVPLIISAPQISKPTAIEQIVRSVDIFPTIIDLLDIAPEITNGVSLKAAADKDLGLAALAESPRHGFALETVSHKYIYPRYKKTKNRLDELYDLTSDKIEKNNIALENIHFTEDMLYAFENELHKMPFPPPKRRLLYFNLKKQTI